MRCLYLFYILLCCHDDHAPTLFAPILCLRCRGYYLSAISTPISIATVNVCQCCFVSITMVTVAVSLSFVPIAMVAVYVSVVYTLHQFNVSVAKVTACIIRCLHSKSFECLCRLLTPHCQISAVPTFHCTLLPQ